ncbi:MAG: cysteine--tRNA ligase [Pseudomonadota bacterium]
MTEIRLWNTRDREEQPVVPRDGKVGLYVCGPTVYDRAHIGNARPAVVFDVLFRLLRHVHGADNVTYVRNFTDVDDKINARAAETRAPRESVMDAVTRITAETTQWYLDDMAALGCLAPTHMPRATAYVNAPDKPADMVRLIETLIAKGHAYEAEGHVLFAVESWEGYGSLSRRSTDELLAGARVDVAPYKRNPMDFVLWKPSSDDQPGWESPWGRGRPGWHIECSAMAKAILGPIFGDRFQIHGGGIDLVFPHHENERAQSCAAHGVDDMADIWMHNGYLMVEGEKMSKSLGNFITVADLRAKGIPGEVIRYVLLKTHYKQPLDWTAHAVDEASKVISRWRRALDAARHLGYDVIENREAKTSQAVLPQLANNLNTWNALRGIDVMAQRLLDNRLEERFITEAAEMFCSGLWLLGFDQLEGAESIQSIAEAEKLLLDALVSERIDALLADRAGARKAKDFTRADAIREGLAAAGVEVTDTPEGATWTLAPGFDPAKLRESTT